MHLKIITPNELLFSGKVEKVEIPTLSGVIGILPHHAPLTTIVSPWKVRFLSKEKEERILDAANFLFENEFTILQVSEGMVVVDGEEIQLFTRSWVDENAVETLPITFEKAHIEIKKLTHSLQTRRIKNLRKR